MNYQKFYNKNLLQNLDSDILIIVEHTVRELDSAVLLKLKLEEIGYKVAIDSPKWNINRLPLMYRPKVVLAPWAYSNSEMRIWSKFKNKFNLPSFVINFHHEQITGSASIDFIKPIDRAINEVYHLTWGEDFYDYLRNICDNELILQFGSLRLDITHPKMNDIGPDKFTLSSEYEIKFDADWILFLSNSFHLQSEKEQSYFETLGVSLKNLAEVGSYNTICFLDYVSNYLSENTNKIFIYRPHPSMIEREKKFSELNNLKKKFPDRFFIIGDLSVNFWIKASSKVLTFHSTCIAEAILNKKQFALIRVRNPNKSDDPEILNPALRIKNFLEFKKFVDGDIGKLDYSSIKKYYYIDKEMASEKMTKFINSLIKSDDESPLKGYSFFQYVFFFIEFFLKFIANYLSTKFKFFRKILLKSNRYKINNLAYLSGSDAYSIEDINKIISYFEKK